MDLPIEFRCDELPPPRGEGPPGPGVVQEPANGVAELPRVVPDEQMHTVEDGETLARLRRRDDGSSRCEIGEDLNPGPAPVGEGGDAHRGVPEDRAEVGDPARGHDVRRSVPRVRGIRAHEEEPCLWDLGCKGAGNEFRRLAVGDVVEVPDEHDVPGIRMLGEGGEPLDIHAVREDVHPGRRVGAFRDDGLPIDVGRHQDPRGVPDRPHLETSGAIEESIEEPLPREKSTTEPSSKERRVCELVREKVPVDVVLVEDHRDPGPELVEAEEVEGLDDDEVRGLDGLPPRKPSPVVRPQSPEPCPANSASS